MSEPDIYTIKLTGLPEDHYVLWRDYERLKADVRNCYTAIRVKDDEYARLKDKSACQTECLDAFDKKLRDAEEKVKHLDLFKSVVEKFFNSADLKNPPDAQSCYALAEKLKQLPDSILDFTEEQVRDNPAWALAVFRHKVKEMQYKRIHDLNAIGGEQEENARLKAEVERLEPELEQRCRELNLSLAQQAIQLRQIGELKAEVERLKEGNEYLGQMHDKEMERSAYLCEQVERLRKAGDAMADELIQEYGREVCLKFGWFKGWNTAKEGKQS